MHPGSIHSPSPFTHLTCYSLISKWITLISFLNILHTIPHNVKVKKGFKCFKNKTLKYLLKYSHPLLSTWLKHLWQLLQPQVFLSMMSTPFSGQFLLCRSSQAPSGWTGSVFALKDIHRLVLKPLLCYLGCVLRVVVLLKGGPSPQSEVHSALEQVFIKDLPVHRCIHLSLDPDWSPSSCC